MKSVARHFAMRLIFCCVSLDNSLFAENIGTLLNNLPTYVIIITSGHGTDAERPARKTKNKYK